MSPDFSAAVDDVFQQMLGILERINNDKNPSEKDVRQRLSGVIGQAEAKLHNSRDWQLAKYALVSWIDDVLGVDAPWRDREVWNENGLEWELFKSNIRFVQFYEQAKEAFALTRKDALETFYVCVVLGFRGMYRDPTAAAAEIERLKLPPDLQTWTNDTARAIRFGQGLPSISEINKPLDGAPPRHGTQMLVWGTFFGLALAALAMFVFFLKTLYSSE